MPKIKVVENQEVYIAFGLRQRKCEVCQNEVLTLDAYAKKNYCNQHSPIMGELNES